MKHILSLFRSHPTIRKEGKASKGNYILASNSGKLSKLKALPPKKPPKNKPTIQTYSSCKVLLFFLNTFQCVLVCLRLVRRLHIYPCFNVCIFFIDSSLTGPLMLQRTKAMYPIMFAFIQLMHCHGCRAGQVLLVIRCMHQLPLSFSASGIAVLRRRQVEGGVGGASCFPGLRDSSSTLCIFFITHQKNHQYPLLQGVFCSGLLWPSLLIWHSCLNGKTAESK